MPHRTRPMTALLVFTGLNAVLVSTITPVYDFVCFLPFGKDGGKDFVRNVRLHYQRVWKQDRDVSVRVLFLVCYTWCGYRFLMYLELSNKR